MKCVEFLAEAARKHPHEAYTSFTKSRRVFIPALVGRRVSDLEKRLFALPTRFAGLGIGVPSKQAQNAYDLLPVASTSMVREAIQ